MHGGDTILARVVHSNIMRRQAWLKDVMESATACHVLACSALDPVRGYDVIRVRPNSC